MSTLAEQIHADLAQLAAATDELAEPCIHHARSDGTTTAVGVFWSQAAPLSVSAPGLGVERHQAGLMATLSRAQLATCTPGDRLVRPDGEAWTLDAVFPVGAHAWQATCSQADERSLMPGRPR